MKVRNVVVVAALFLGLLAYILKFEIPVSERREAEKKPFHNVSKAQLASFEIQHGAENFKLQNSRPEPARVAPDEEQKRKMDAVTPDDWSIVGLAWDRVDAANLNAVITQISALELEEPLPATELESDLSLYGLSRPEVVMIAESLDKYSNPKQIKMEFGKKSDFLAKRYLRYTRVDGSSDIFLTDDLLFFALSKPLKDFRKKEPIAFADSEIQKIEFARPSQSRKIKLEKMPSKVPGDAIERWAIVSPLSFSADQSKVSQDLRNLRTLKAKDFIEGADLNSKESLFESPIFSASLQKKEQGSRPIDIVVASEKNAGQERFYFKIDGVSAIFEAEADTSSGISGSVSDYLKTKFFEIDVDQVQTIDLSGSFVLGLKGEKKDQLWKINDKQGDETFIRQWLMDLKELKATGFPGKDVKEYGFSAPSYRLVSKMEDFAAVDNKTLERVLVIGSAAEFKDGKPAAFFAAVDDLSEPFIISKDDFDKIIPKAEGLVLVPTAAPSVTATK